MKHRPFAPARRATRASLLVGLALLLVGAWTARARSDPDWVDTPEARAKLRQALVEGTETDQWDQVLLGKLLLQARDNHPDLYGSIVGPIFAVEDLTRGMEPEGRRRLFAHLIAHLVGIQPTDDTVLLVAAFLPHLAADAELLDLLRKKMPPDPLTLRATSWERLQRSVAAKLADGDPTVRRAAIRITGRREGADLATGVALLAGALAAAGTRLDRADLQAYLDAFETLLGHRFASLAALSAFLEPFRGRLAKHAAWGPIEREQMRGDLWEAVSALSAAEGGRDKERSREAARFYGRLLLSKASSPQDFVSFFRAEGDQDPELQREALGKAKGLAPAADEAWADLLMRCLDHSTDGKVLDQVIEILGPTFLKPSPPAQQLASAVARRLKARARTDSIRQRTELARILGVIGTVQDVHLALPDAKDLGAGNGQQAPVTAALVRAVGLVQRGFVAGLVPYLRATDGRAQPQWARQAVAEALGLRGFQNSETQGPLAALMLEHILTGKAVEQGNSEDPNAFALPGADPEPDAGVRAAAIDSMQHYPGPVTAPVLREIARTETSEAERAINVLGRQLRRGSVDAGEAFAVLLGEGPVEARLLALLETVAKETPPDLPAGARTDLAAVIRGVLTAADAPAPVRLRAAQCVVRLADEQGVEPVVGEWTRQQDEAARAEWKQVLLRLFVALGAAGAERPGLDERVAARLGAIVEDGRHADALQILDAMGENADRFWLKYARADAHYSYASVSAGRSAEERRGDLDEAIRLYTDLIDRAPKAANRHDVLRSLYRILQDRARPPYAEEGQLEKARRFLWLALEVAVKLADPQVARDALDRVLPELEQGNQRSDEDKARLEQYRKDLKAVAEKP